MQRAAGLFLFLIGALFVGAAPAMAGGSWFTPIETDIEPGDTITMVGFSGFGPERYHDIDWQEPFYAYLELDRSLTTTYPQVHEGMVPLGRITVTATGKGGWQSYRLHITFRIPEDTQPGIYSFVHCNDPCMATFGELIGGAIKVGDPSPDATFETVAGSYASPAEMSTANLDDPLVRELLNPGPLAATGSRALEFAMVSGALLAIGALAMFTSRLTRTRMR